MTNAQPLLPQALPFIAVECVTDGAEVYAKA